VARPAATAPIPAAIERALALLEPAERPRDPGAAARGGYLDLLGDGEAPAPTGTTQRLMLTSAVPAIYERWWRPALGRVAKGVLGPGMADEHRIARLLLGLSPGDGVLDVACGPGNFTRDFARTVGETGLAVGIDASPTMLARAVRDTPDPFNNTAYVRGDAVNLPFRDASFDAVCCFAALHLFDEPFTALDHMARVLTPGGRVAIFTSAGPRTRPLRMAAGLVGAGGGMRMFGPDEVVDALRRRGFRDVRRRATGLTQFVGGRRR
jgi:SAM-dependent methyltransferase